MKIGDIFYRNKKKCHVVLLFTDDGNEIITYKYWSKRYMLWEYLSERIEDFNFKLKLGTYVKNLNSEMVVL